MPLATVALLLVAAYVSGPFSTRDAYARPPGAIIHDAWARATPPAATMGAIYLTLQSATGDHLIEARVPGSVAARTEIHETVMVADSSGGDGGGQMMMRRVESIELPPGEEVQLKPGGYHVMLFDLKKPLKQGARIKLTLILEKAGKVQTTATVRGT